MTKRKRRKILFWRRENSYGQENGSKFRTFGRIGRIFGYKNGFEVSFSIFGFKLKTMLL